MPHVFFFAMLLAAFEMTTGMFILSKGPYVRVGLAASVSFNLFLVQLGLTDHVELGSRPTRQPLA
jgi:hypothetical protein